MREIKIVSAKADHPQAWLWEPLEDDSTFLLKSMFGSKGAYLDGKLMLCFCARREPFRGILVCTSREHHASLMADFPELVIHSYLEKWLYLPEVHGSFERVAEKLVLQVRRRDPRIGVLPSPKKKKARQSATPRQQ
jgi:hypothetical protein